MYRKTLYAGWADMDFNSHMKNTAYLDKTADVRQMFLIENGFPIEEFLRLRIGPVVMRLDRATRPVQLIVIKPLGYRLQIGGRLLYRQPAYLVCTDPNLPLKELLQQFLCFRPASLAMAGLPLRVRPDRHWASATRRGSDRRCSKSRRPERRTMITGLSAFGHAACSMPAWVKTTYCCSEITTDGACASRSST